MFFSLTSYKRKANDKGFETYAKEELFQNE